MQPQNENVKTIQVVPNPDTIRAQLEAAIKKVAAFQREAEMTSDLSVKQQLVGQVALLQSNAQKLAKELGFTEMPSLRKLQKPGQAAPVRFLPTEELTVDQVLTLAAAGHVTPEGAAALADAAKAGVQVITPWVPPPFPPMPDAQSVAAFFAGAKTMVPVAAVQRSPKDPNWKKEGGLKNFATVQQPPQYVGQDGEWISLLQQLPARYERERQVIRQALQRAVSGHYVGSGPIEGWFARIKAGDERPHPKFSLSAKELEEVFAVLPWDETRAPTFKGQDLLDVLRRVKVNPAAGAGMPRMKKKGEVLKLVLEDAVQYYELLTNKALAAYQKQHPGEFLTIAKAKLDRYEQAEWGKKIRPYYNLNGGMGLLYSAVIQAYSSALLGFWEKEDSCNAHGFAWNNGGGDRLYSWVKTRAAKGPGLYALGYSDDGLWVIVDSEGRTLVSDRDIAQCDASCGDDHLPAYREHVTRVLKNALTEGWANVKNAACAAVFGQLVLLYKSLVYYSRNKIHSGVPGTAEADQIAFATAFVLIRSSYNKLVEAKEDPREAFAKAEKLLADRIGLTFKASQWHLFKPDQEEYSWTFLGKRLVKHRGNYIPKVDLDKAVVQLVTPKKNSGGLEGQRAWMERCRGLAVTSLYSHPPLFALAKEAYERKLKAGIQPAPTFDGADAEERDLDQILGYGVEVKFPSAEFPRYEWIIALYTGVLSARADPGQEKVVVVQPARSAADFFDEAFPAAPEDAPGMAWGDTVPEAPQRVAAQKTLEESQRLPGPIINQVPAGPAQYTLAPLPEEVKQAYRDARIAYARRISAEAPRKKRGGYVRGGAVEALETGGSSLVFTKEGIQKVWDEAYNADFQFTNPEFYDDSDWVEYEHPSFTETDEEWGRRMEAEADKALESKWEQAQNRARGRQARK